MIDNRPVSYSGVQPSGILTIGNYLDSKTREETIFLTVPCSPREEYTVLTPNTCTEDGSAV